MSQIIFREINSASTMAAYK